VLESSVLQYLDFAGTDGTALSPVRPVLVESANVVGQATSWETLPDDGVNLGRAMRCRMMSYLC
jgi:hypothetical protein